MVQVLESLLSIDHWHRPAKLGAIRTGRVTHICQRHWVGHMSLAMFCFFFVCILLELACYLQKRIAPCKAGVETSCREVHLRKASYAVILSLGRINSLQLLAARTGGGAYPVEVCRQGKCDNARLQKAAVRQASVWVRCIRLWHT